MNRRAIVRGIQLIVAITLLTFAFVTFDSIHSKQANLAAGFANLAANGIHILHRRAGVLHEDHSLAALQPFLIRRQHLFLALFGNCQRNLTSFQQKVFATL